MIKHSRHRHLFPRQNNPDTRNDLLTLCFSPPLNTSLHSFRVCQPPSLEGKYDKCTASRISANSSIVRRDSKNWGYVCGYIILRVYLLAATHTHFANDTYWSSKEPVTIYAR